MEKQEITTLITILKKDDLLEWKKIFSKSNINDQVLYKIIEIKDDENIISKLIQLRNFIYYTKIFLNETVLNDALIELLSIKLSDNALCNLINVLKDLNDKSYEISLEDIKKLINCGFLYSTYYKRFIDAIFLPCKNGTAPLLAKEYLEFAISEKHPNEVLTFLDMYKLNCPINILKIVYKKDVTFSYILYEMIKKGATKEKIKTWIPILNKIYEMNDECKKLLLDEIEKGATPEKIKIVLNKKLNYEQMITIIQFYNLRLDIEILKIIANSKYSVNQMHYFIEMINIGYKLNELSNYTGPQIEQLALGIKNNIDIEEYNNPKYTSGKMYYIRKGLERNLNVDLYKNNDYTDNQIKQLYLGLEQGLDAYKYSDPNFTPKQMQFLREIMYRQNNENLRIKDKSILDNETYKRYLKDIKCIEHDYSNEEINFLYKERDEDWTKYKTVQIDRLCNPKYNIYYMIIMTNIMGAYSFNNEELDFLFDERFLNILNSKEWPSLCVVQENFVIYNIAKAITINGIEKCKEYLNDNINDKAIETIAKGLSKGFTDEQILFLTKHHHFPEEKIDIIIDGIKAGLTLEQISIFAHLNLSTYKMETTKTLLFNEYSDDIIKMYLDNKFDAYKSSILYKWIKENLNYNQIKTIKEYLSAGFNEYEIKDIARFLKSGYDEEILKLLVNPYEYKGRSNIIETIQEDLVSDEIYCLLLTKK